MHKAITLKHGNHHLPGGIPTRWHHIDEHFHSLQFWIGMILALMIVSFITLLYIVTLNDLLM